tara:strand:+ start:1131 stop:3038 length:1908 start_codon:yes stop_codon:yes gene_type:complete
MTEHIIKTYVISLDSRQDRKDLFEETNNGKLSNYKFVSATDGRKTQYSFLKRLGYDTQYDWIDPILNTTLSKGEIGCFISHYKLWKQCIKEGTPFFIMEDDAIIKNRLPYNEIKDLVDRGYNFIYLGWKEMDEDGSIPIDDKFVVPKYPYWGLSYLITPQAADILVNKVIEKHIIPVDEYLPLKMKELNPIAYKENIVIPWDRSKGGSDINPTERYDYYVDFDVHSITVGSDSDKCDKLFKSGSSNGFNFINLGEGVEWTGGTMEGPGGGQKVTLLKKHLEKLPDRDVVIFCDGYDVFVADHIDEVICRYLSMHHKVVFAAERHCWPDQDLSDKLIQRNRELNSYNTPYEYLNSGLFIGKVSELKKILSKDIKNADDDQLFYQKQYISGDYDIILDQEAYIFQCHESKVYKERGQLYNPLTRCFNCIYHGNGGEEEKRTFNNLYDVFYNQVAPIVYIPTCNKYEIINRDMLLIDYMTPYMCDSLIEIADKNGQWDSLEYDKFPAKEIRLKALGLWDEMEKYWKESIYPIVEEFWWPSIMYGIRDAFVMRYSLDTQTNLNLHCDASLVTGSIKLNDDYEGADLVFPRQRFSNKDIPVGKCILFPGQLTHGHECQQLISGVKYSLTIWSSRYTDDLI